MNIGNFIGTRLDGTLVTNLNTQSGRVVVLAEQPLLEAFLGTNRQPALVLYGQVGTNHLLQSTTDLRNPGSWRPVGTVTMTNLWQTFESVVGTNRMLFFRARRE